MNETVGIGRTPSVKQRVDITPGTAFSFEIGARLVVVLSDVRGEKENPTRQIYRLQATLLPYYEVDLRMPGGMPP